ncbi:MAG: N-acetylmuramic acid 6-phosphate etherase [Spirochaetaceae bacterium]|nr:N-acetylmuramic acid 6-phosphate etherase [Spirochaetaceae bacterium]
MHQDPLEGSTTEARNPRSKDIDRLPALDILRLINDEDKNVPFVVETALPELSALTEAIVEAFKAGGRLVYIGAGTSGRLGVLDASECPPTYGTDPNMVRGIIAGGDPALRRSIEGAEDDETGGRHDLEAISFSGRDVLVGITASGSAPYVLGAMAYAASLGAVVGAISCNRNSRTFDFAAHRILLEVGPEIVTGSTRMKAGTAQKLVLNMLTTASMIRLGKVYGNLMVDLRPVNRKLVERSKRLIRQAVGCGAAEAEKAFEASGHKPKTAILMLLLGVGKERALELERDAGGRIGDALDLAKAPAGPGRREGE